MLTTHLRPLAFAPPALALLACGARPSLDVDTRAASTASVTGAGGATGTAGGTTSTTGTGGAGAGGAACSTLTWAGEPVFVPAIYYTPGFVRLLRTGIGEHALVFDMAVPDATLLESAALPAWWTSWPPQMGMVGTSDALGWQFLGHVVSPGEPGSFAFMAMNGDGKLGQAKPGEMSNALATWSGPLVGEVKTLARSNGGAYLAGYGPQGGLAVDLLPAFVTNPTPLTIGALGCASMPITASAVGLGDDAFLLASTNDTPFDNCFDPVLPGPPTVVQILRISTTGDLQQAGFIEESAPVLDVQLAGRIGGAWLYYRADGDPTLHIRPVDQNGQLGEDVGLFGSPLYGDAIAALGDGFAHAFVFPGAPDHQAPPFVSLYVRTGANVVQIDKPFTTPVHPRGRPAVAISDDGRSILVAFIEDPEDGTALSIGLLRADCAP